MQHPVVVIGAGFCGIAALKIAREYSLDVICYDKTDAIGGLWRYRDEDIDGLPSVMKSTIIDSSKELEAFSDFPMPAEFANNMHNTQVLQYCELYADHFKLHPYIKLHHEVKHVAKADNFSSTGEWDVHVRNNKTGEESKVRASAVMICTGHHCFPHMPDFPGLSDFKGFTMHSHSYKDFHPFESKNVVIVGIGNSAVDAAVDLSRVCPKLYLSTRRGTWLYARVGDDGLPFDTNLNTRFSDFIHSITPQYIMDRLEIRKFNKRFDHAKYNLKPEHFPRQQHVTVSDELPSRILAGAVTVKGNVRRFTSNGVIFEGEDTEYPIDAIVFSTGYNFKFPFIPEDVIKVVKNRCDLYRRVFPMTIDHPTMAVIGLLQPLGAIFTSAEMQSRWAISIFLNKIKLPSRHEMLSQHAVCQAAYDKNFLDTQRHTLEESYIPYMDMLAKDVDCKPNLLQLLFTDPKLFWAVVFWPTTAYQYRLQGPNPWPGARQAILTVWDRIYAPLNTNKSFKKNKDCCTSNHFTFFLFLSIITILLYLLFA